MYGRRMNMMVVEYFYDVCLCLEDCTSPTALWFKAGEFSTKPVPEAWLQLGVPLLKSMQDHMREKNRAFLDCSLGSSMAGEGKSLLREIRYKRVCILSMG